MSLEVRRFQRQQSLIPDTILKAKHVSKNKASLRPHEKKPLLDRTYRFYRYTSEILYALSVVGHYDNIIETYTIAYLLATALIAG